MESISQAVVTSIRDQDESATVSDITISRDVARLSEMADMVDGPEDDDNGKARLIPTHDIITFDTRNQLDHKFRIDGYDNLLKLR